MNKKVLCFVFFMGLGTANLLSQKNDAKNFDEEFTIYSKILEEER